MSSSAECPASFDRLASYLGLRLHGDTWAGQVRGQQVVLTWAQEQRETKYHVVTRSARPESIHVGFERELDLGLNVRRKHDGSFAGSFKEVPFEQSVQLEADEPDRLGLLMTPDVVSGWQLLETMVPRSVQWGLSDSSFYLSAGASGMADPVLSQLMESALDQVLLLQERASSIRVPEPLERHAEIWQAFARAQDLTVQLAPLRMQGAIEHFQVRARVMRTDVLEYRSELVVAFPRSLNLDLLVEPQSSVELPGEWNDTTLGDAAFDSAFRVSSHDPSRTRNLFDRQSRQLLMEMASQAVNFELNDERIAIWPSFALEPAGTIPQLIMHATDLATRMLRGAEGRPTGTLYR